jgi:SAM-dependent methyltransferase
VAVLVWKNQISQSIACPVCRGIGEKHIILNISHYADHTGEYWEPVDLILCHNCETKFYQPCFSIPHENLGLVKFYVEQDAGINGMLELFLMVDDRPIKNYMEIGGGFGFSLDYAKRILGWNVRGYDPSAIAECGRDLLGLPISNTYFDETSAEIGSIDLILSSEVIEHIADPIAHIRLAGLALKPDGLLLLTTPNASSVQPGMAPELMPILSPGQHLVLFTPAALRRLLTENGFPFVRIVEKGDQIRVAASMIPFSGDSAYFSRDLYWQYLDSSATRNIDNSALFVGFLGRLYKEYVHAARFHNAQPLFERLRKHILTQYHYDIEWPQSLSFPAAGTVNLIEFGEKWSFNLCAIWYCRGMSRQLAERDLVGAVEMFDAAARFGHALRGTLHSFGADDGETAHLCRESELAMIGPLAQTNPTAAVAALERIAANRFGLDPVMLAAHLGLARRRLFGDLINLGHFSTAAQVMSASEFLSIDEPLGGVASVFAYGLHLLNTGADPADASAIFARVRGAAAISADVSMAALERQAEIEHAAALARFAPAEAVAIFEAAVSNHPALGQTELDIHIAAARNRLLGDLVNLGHAGHAIRIMSPTHCLPPAPTSLHLTAARTYGAHLLNDRNDAAGASTVFMAIGAAAAWGDDEMRRLGREVEIDRVAALTRFDPAEAVTALDEIAANRFMLAPTELDIHLDTARRQLLIDLINLGHFETAADLPPTLGTAADWPVLNGLALIELLHHKQPAKAAALFEQAFVQARSDHPGAPPAEAARIKRHEVLSHLVAGDAAAAITAARFLIGPVAEDWIPTEIRQETEALLKDHPEVLAQVLEG